MIDVISWMHGLGVLHRFVARRSMVHLWRLITCTLSDMKPENCLLDDDMRLKITDFGTAKILKEDDRGANWAGRGI